MVDPRLLTLLTLTKVKKLAIYDSNVKISKAKVIKNSILFSLDYGDSVELIVSKKPKQVLYNDRAIEFSYIKNKLSFVIKDKGEVEIKF